MKRIWIVFPVVLLVFAGMMMLGCPEADDGKKDDITWTLDQEGGVNGEADTTHIVFHFSDSVTNLEHNDIEIIGERVSSTVNPEGSGKTWKLPITVNEPGSIQIKINKEGIDPGPKEVVVYSEKGEAPLNYTAVADGETDKTTSTKITFTFEEPIDSLQANQIIFTTNTTSNIATKGELTGEGATWVLAIEVIAQGNVDLRVNKDGIDGVSKNVPVYLQAGKVVTGDWKWTTFDDQKENGTEWDNFNPNAPAIGKSEIELDETGEIDGMPVIAVSGRLIYSVAVGGFQYAFAGLIAQPEKIEEGDDKGLEENDYVVDLELLNHLQTAKAISFWIEWDSTKGNPQNVEVKLPMKALRGPLEGGTKDSSFHSYIVTLNVANPKREVTIPISQFRQPNWSRVPMNFNQKDIYQINWQTTGAGTGTGNPFGFKVWDLKLHL